MVTRTGARSALALGIVVLVAVGGAAVLGSGSPAAAAGGSISVSPQGPYVGGESVTVAAGGFGPNDPVAVSVCPRGRAINGPGDCGRTSNGHSQLHTANGSGFVVASLTVPEQGALGNLTPPPLPTPTPTPTHPTPTIAYSPAGALRGGDRVEVVARGFRPGTEVLITQCPSGRVPRSERDCAPLTGTASYYAYVDRSGVALGQVSIVRGPLRNLSLPKVKCGNAANPCSIYAFDPADRTPLVSRAISYPATKDRPEVLVTMRKKKGKVGRTTYFHTSVGQAYATYEGVRVALQRKAGSSWRTVKRARLDGMSRHSFRFRPTEAKTYRWRVRIGATEFHTVATSKVQRLKVRPQRR